MFQKNWIHNDHTLRSVLDEAVEKLAVAGVEDPRIDAEALLAHVLGCHRAALRIRLRDDASGYCIDRFASMVERRMSHEPLAYILGFKEFYGLEFYVTCDTLIPRPETEMLVDEALDVAGKIGTEDFAVVDVGTGSGAIAITLATKLAGCHFIATDISLAALEVARKNAKQHGVLDRVRFLVGDLLEPLESSVDLIVANLPYVTTHEWFNLSEDIRQFEPRTALVGGFDGLDVVRRLLLQAQDKLLLGGALLLEISPWQRDKVLSMAGKCFPHAVIETVTDLSGLERVVRIKLPKSSDNKGPDSI